MKLKIITTKKGNKITDFNNENKNEIIKIDNYDSNDKAYSDIFKEMLYLENLKGLQDKTKY